MARGLVRRKDSQLGAARKASARAPSCLASDSIAPEFAGAITVLGIDPGLDRTGYAVLRLPDGHIFEAGVIRSQNRLSLPRRLAEIFDGVEEILNDHPVQLVAVEDLFAHYRHPRTAILMGHARGIVLLAAARRELEVVSLLPTKVKKALTGNGHAGKMQVQRAIAVTLHLPRLPEPSDVADALAIAWCAAMLHGNKLQPPTHSYKVVESPRVGRARRAKISRTPAEASA